MTAYSKCSPPPFMVLGWSFTFTLEPLLDETPQHLSTEVTEMWRLVGVDGQVMALDLEVLHCDLGCKDKRKLITPKFLSEHTALKTLIQF